MALGAEASDERPATDMNPKKLIFSLLCLQNAAISLNVAALTAVIPTISNDLNILDITISKIIPFYMIPYGLGALIYAPLAKRFSSRSIMVVTMFLFAVTNLLCGMASAIGHLLILRAIMGIAGAGVVPLGLILIGRLFENNVRGRLVGLFFSVSFVASIIGIVLSGLAHWRWLFFVPASLGLLSAVCLTAFKSDYLRKIEGPVNYLNVFRNVKMRNIFIYIIILSMLYHGIDRWMGVYLARTYHLKQLTISLLFGLIAVSGAAGQLWGGYLTDKKGRLRSCQIGIMMLAIAAMALYGVFPLFVVAIILVVWAVGWTVGHNGASTVLTDFPDDNRSEVASLNSSLRFVAGGIGFFISGLFVEKSFGLTFLAIGILMLILAPFLKRLIPQE